jgi:hypothetical protein
MRGKGFALLTRLEGTVGEIWASCAVFLAGLRAGEDGGCRCSYPAIASSQMKESAGFVTIYTVITQGRCMARGRKTSLTIHLTPSERRTLQAWQRATTIRAGLARRGRIILLLADGMTITDIATTVGISRRFVYKWAQRFLEQGLAGLADQPGRGHRRGQ